MDMHFEVLPKQTNAIFSLLGKNPWIESYYLAGGTALALLIGHRISNDLDFFSPDSFDNNLIIQKLSQLGKFELEKKEEQTVIGILDGAKISFLGYHYPLLEIPTAVGSVSVAHMLDIACMKIDAIANRGAKRDFIDLYVIAKGYIPMEKIFDNFKKKFASLNYNMMHIKKSLIYFEDAERDADPKMIVPMNWEEVKVFFREKISEIS